MPSRSPPPWEGGGHLKVRELVDAMRLPADYTPQVAWKVRGRPEAGVARWRLAADPRQALSCSSVQLDEPVDVPARLLEVVDLALVAPASELRT
jgi:hypothetical protein